jgi:hypothetical protein
MVPTQCTSSLSASVHSLSGYIFIDRQEKTETTYELLTQKLEGTAEQTFAEVVEKKGCQGSRKGESRDFCQFWA